MDKRRFCSRVKTNSQGLGWTYGVRVVNLKTGKAFGIVRYIGCTEKGESSEEAMATRREDHIRAAFKRNKDGKLANNSVFYVNIRRLDREGYDIVLEDLGKIASPGVDLTLEEASKLERRLIEQFQTRVFHGEGGWNVRSGNSRGQKKPGEFSKLSRQQKRVHKNLSQKDYERDNREMHLARRMRSQADRLERGLDLVGDLTPMHKAWIALVKKTRGFNCMKLGDFKAKWIREGK